MLRAALVLLVASLSGVVACGGAAGPSHPPSVVSNGAPDALDRLLARLPRGAERCSGARVGAVASARRASVKRISGLGALPWGPDSPIVAYAEVAQEDPERGRRATFALLRVSDVPRMRLYLEERAELRVLWDEGGRACPGPACWELRAERVDSETIRLRRGPWDERGRGVETRCVDMARRFPDALEVSAWTAANGLFSAHPFEEGGLEGFDVASVLLPFGDGLRRVEQYRLPHEDLAEEIALLLQGMRRDEGGLGTVAEQSRVARGDILEVRTDVRWEDLELLAGDEQRFHEAMALEASSHDPLPLADVDVGDIEVVREQIALRTRELSNADPDQRPAAAEALRTLLERAAEAHIGHDVFVEHLVELLLGELDDAAAAVAWTERVLARGPHDRAAWQARRRRALSRVGAAELTEALRDDGVVRHPRRAAAAGRALAGLPASASYEMAEGAWLGAEILAGVTPPMRAARGALPLDSLVETLLTLADAGGSSRSVHVRVEGDRGADDRSRATSAALRWVEGTTEVRSGAATTDASDGGYRMARELVAGLPGDVRVVLALSPIGGDLEHPEAVIAVEGSVTGDTLELRRASALQEGRDRTQVRWDRVGALVGAPIDGYEMRLFPPPNVHAELADAPEAERFLERVEQEPVLSCIRLARREASVRCNAAPQRDATRRAWRRAIGPLVFR